MRRAPDPEPPLPFYHLLPPPARAEANLPAAAPPQPSASNSAAAVVAHRQPPDSMRLSQSLLIRYRACLVPDALFEHQSASSSARPDNRPRHGKPQTKQEADADRAPSAERPLSRRRFDRVPTSHSTLDSRLSPFVPLRALVILRVLYQTIQNTTAVHSHGTFHHDALACNPAIAPPLTHT